MSEKLHFVMFNISSKKQKRLVSFPHYVEIHCNNPDKYFVSRSKYPQLCAITHIPLDAIFRQTFHKMNLSKCMDS